MEKHLHLAICIFLFGIVSVYAARLPDAEQTGKIHSDGIYENFKSDKMAVDQGHSQEARLSRVIRSSSMNAHQSGSALFGRNKDDPEKSRKLQEAAMIMERRKKEEKEKKVREEKERKEREEKARKQIEDEKRAKQAAKEKKDREEKQRKEREEKERKEREARQKKEVRNKQGWQKL